MLIFIVFFLLLVHSNLKTQKLKIWVIIDLFLLLLNYNFAEMQLNKQ